MWGKILIGGAAASLAAYFAALVLTAPDDEKDDGMSSDEKLDKATMESFKQTLMQSRRQLRSTAKCATSVR